jgi:hypothetical protein
LIDHALMFRLEFDGHDSNLAQLHRSYGETFGCILMPATAALLATGLSILMPGSGEANDSPVGPRIGQLLERQARWRCGSRISHRLRSRLPSLFWVPNVLDTTRSTLGQTWTDWGGVPTVKHSISI